MNNPKRFRGFMVVILVLVMAAAAFYAFFGDPTDPANVNFDDSGPRIVALSALAFVFLASFLFGQPKAREILHGTVFWGGFCALLVVGYVYKAELVQAGYRVLGALAPGLAVTQPDGTILIVRDAGGHFVLDGRINGARVEFLLDTGASAVVLTYEDAIRAGVPSARSDVLRARFNRQRARTRRPCQDRHDHHRRSHAAQHPGFRRPARHARFQPLRHDRARPSAQLAD